MDKILKKDASKFCGLNEHRSSPFHFHAPNFKIRSDPTAEKERENCHFSFARKNKFKLESYHPILIYLSFKSSFLDGLTIKRSVMNHNHITKFNIDVNTFFGLFSVFLHD